MKLTENEKLVYELISQRISEGYPPTVREICAKLGFRSTSTAHRYINSLASKGLIEKGDNQNRAIRLAGKSPSRVPVVGKVTAGSPITAIEDITDYISFIPPKSYDGELFALRVSGDSMINAGIFSGDRIIVRQQSTAENGEMVVALIDDSATVKTYYREKDHIRLQPENDTMDPIIVDSCQILGKVYGVIRIFR